MRSSILLVFVSLIFSMSLHANEDSHKKELDDINYLYLFAAVFDSSFSAPSKFSLDSDTIGESYQVWGMFYKAVAQNIIRLNLYLKRYNNMCSELKNKKRIDPVKDYHSLRIADYFKTIATEPGTLAYSIPALSSEEELEAGYADKISYAEVQKRANWNLLNYFFVSDITRADEGRTFCENKIVSIFQTADDIQDSADQASFNDYTSIYELYIKTEPDVGDEIKKKYPNESKHVQFQRELCVNFNKLASCLTDLNIDTKLGNSTINDLRKNKGAFADHSIFSIDDSPDETNLEIYSPKNYKSTETK